MGHIEQFVSVTVISRLVLSKHSFVSSTSLVTMGDFVPVNQVRGITECIPKRSWENDIKWISRKDVLKI